MTRIPKPRQSPDFSVKPKNRLAKKLPEEDLSPLKNLKRLRTKLVDLRVGYRKDQVSAVCEICAQGVAMSENAAAFEVFINDPFWEKNPKQRPKSTDQPMAVKYALRFACGPGNTASKKASEYFRAIWPLLQAGVKPVDLAAEIGKIGSWKKVLKLHASKTRSVPGAVSNKLAASEADPKESVSEPSVGSVQAAIRDRLARRAHYLEIRLLHEWLSLFDATARQSRADEADRTAKMCVRNRLRQLSSTRRSELADLLLRDLMSPD